MRQILSKFYIIPLIICFVIFYLCCLIPVNDIPDIPDEWFFDFPIDKLVHFCMFFGLSGSVAFNYLCLKKERIKLSSLICIALFLPILYGGIIELLQHYFFYPRTGDWFDFLADALGALSGLLTVMLTARYFVKN